MADIALIEGLTTMPVVRPSSVADVGQLVKQAAAENSAIFTVGGRTKLHLGCLDPIVGRKAQAVETIGLHQIIDFPARDMTVTVQAGITIAQLQTILAPENLTLPIDVPHADRATLGGILATNTSGSRRLGYGTLRDYLLGFNAINDEGQEFKAGGRVVKNVAGYDLCKLMIGSMGTLGILTQATLKLKPLAEEQAGVMQGCEIDQLARVLDRLHGSRTRPVCLDLLNRAAASLLFQQAGLEAPASWIVLAGFEGNGEAVHWQVQQLVRELAELGLGTALQARIGCTNAKLCHALVEFPALDQAVLSLKANILPSGLPEFCRSVEQLGGAERTPLLQAHAGNGIVLGHFLGDLPQDRAVGILNAWREQAGKFQGSVIVTRCPAAWRTPGFVWGPGRDESWLMKAVKEKFDPRRLFNPGRFVGGI